MSEQEVENGYCDFCGYNDKPVREDEDGYMTCDNCDCECNWCGDKKGCEFIQDDMLTVCRKCFEDNGVWCEECGHFFYYEEMMYNDYLDNSMCEGCFEYATKGWVCCDGCNMRIPKDDKGVDKVCLNCGDMSGEE